MLNRFTTILIGSSVALAVIGTPMHVRAQSTNKATPPPKTADKKSAGEKSEAPAKKQSIPFQGHLLEINDTAKTIKVDKRTFEITHETKIHRGEKEAVLKDGIKGEYVTGSYTKGEDGKLIAKSVYFGGKTKDKGASKDSSKTTEKK
jgi:hypothetical protein